MLWSVEKRWYSFDAFSSQQRIEHLFINYLRRLILAATFINSYETFAADAASEKIEETDEPTQKTIKKKPKKNGRQNQQPWGLGAQGAALGLGLGEPAFGMEATYHFNRDLEFFGNFLYGSADFRKDIQPSVEVLIVVEAARFRSMQFLTGAKYFLGSSFFVSAGAGIRRIEGLLEFQKEKTLTLEMNTSSDSFVLAGGIGNKWYLSNRFFVSAEWLSLNFPIANSSQSQTTSNGVDEKTHKELSDVSEKLAEKLASATGATALNMTVGLTF